MQLAFFYFKDIHNFFWKIIDFIDNLEMPQITGGGNHVLCVIIMRTEIDMWFTPNNLYRDFKTYIAFFQ